jgi:hypothetical protein
MNRRRGIRFSSKNARDSIDSFRAFYRIRAPMVSSTQQTQRIRQRKARAVGSRRKRDERANGTPKFAIHPEGYSPTAPDARPVAAAKK